MIWFGFSTSPKTTRFRSRMYTVMGVPRNVPDSKRQYISYSTSEQRWRWRLKTKEIECSFTKDGPFVSMKCSSRSLIFSTLMLLAQPIRNTHALNTAFNWFAPTIAASQLHVKLRRIYIGLSERNVVNLFNKYINFFVYI